mmetsp:Transcript_1917/g.3460  ORF Transcript_1917/g.3460 Transcript_1917/m.3460 type:complete len:117 (+) Transcript_1917:548-898(+)
MWAFSHLFHSAVGRRAARNRCSIARWERLRFAPSTDVLCQGRAHAVLCLSVSTHLARRKCCPLHSQRSLGRTEYEDGDQVTVLPCNHFFHSGCAMKWLSRSTRCPICRHDSSAHTR